MPEYTVDSGETREVAKGNPGDKFTVECISGEVRTEKREMLARNGRRIRSGRWAEVQLREPREAVWIHGEQDGSKVEVWDPGFFIAFGTSDPQTEQPRDQSRRSAEAVVEINADQTSSISTGGSQTSTITASTGELWTLREFYYEFTHNNDNNASGEEMRVTVETESEGVELAFVDTQNMNSGNSLFYDSGGWRADGGLDTSRDGLDRTDVKIDSTNGINVVVENDSTGDDAFTDTRKIRFVFEVTTV